MKPSEHQIQQSIITFLRYKGWYVMRLNSGKYSVGEGRARRFIMGQEAGTPDLMCFKTELVKVGDNPIVPRHTHTVDKVRLLFIEVKAGKNKPTPIQIAKMKELEEYGARCIVAHSVEEVQAAL